jgi:hypothetical protein
MSVLGGGLKFAVYCLCVDAYIFTRTAGGAFIVARLGERVSGLVGEISYATEEWPQQHARSSRRPAQKAMLADNPLLVNSPYASQAAMLAEFDALEGFTNGTMFVLHGVRPETKLCTRGGMLTDGGAHSEALRVMLCAQPALQGVEYISAAALAQLPNVSRVDVIAARWYAPAAQLIAAAAGGVLSRAAAARCAGMKLRVCGLKVDAKVHPFEAAVLRGRDDDVPWAPSAAVDVSVAADKRAMAWFVWADANDAERRNTQEPGIWLCDGVRCFTQLPLQFVPSPGYPCWQTNMSKTLIDALLAEVAGLPCLSGAAKQRVTLQLQTVCSSAFNEHYHSGVAEPAVRGMSVYKALACQGLLCVVMGQPGWLAFGASKEELTASEDYAALMRNIRQQGIAFAATQPPCDVARQLKKADSFAEDRVKARAAQSAASAARAEAERARAAQQAAERLARAARSGRCDSDAGVSSGALAAGAAGPSRAPSKRNRDEDRQTPAGQTPAAGAPPPRSPKLHASAAAASRKSGAQQRAADITHGGAVVAAGDVTLDDAAARTQLVAAVRAASRRLPAALSRGDKTLLAFMKACTSSLQTLELQLAPASADGAAHKQRAIVLAATPAADASGNVLLTLLLCDGRVLTHVLPAAADHGAGYNVV